MKIRLESLDHQQRAIDAVTAVFHGVDLAPGDSQYQNPIIQTDDPTLLTNIDSIQNGRSEGIVAVPNSWRCKVDEGPLGIDVRMETGTGKTYVYTRLMFELHSKFGFNKFIVLVPSTPIKEGTKNFIESDYAREHFDVSFSGTRLRLEVLNAQKNKPGRKTFPQAVRNFVTGPRLEKNSFHCLLTTGHMLRSEKTLGYDYDQMVMGSSSVPYDALRETRPIVIIDEPHRFKRDKADYRCLLQKIQPQAIIRFGATFPVKAGSDEIDYNNLVFNLGTCESFNEQLIKGVAVQYPESPEGETTKIRLTKLSRSKPKSATFVNLGSKKTFELNQGSSLAEIHPDFRGITIQEFGKSAKDGVTLSNDHQVRQGDVLTTGVFSETYQDIMLKRSLENHFEQEWENFNKTRKIKTLSLYFIDSVDSYRGEGSSGHLRDKFENLLTAKLEREIASRKSDTSPIASEYLAYLAASLAEIKSTNGGYFAVDNSTSDEAIQDEVDQILRDKERLLSFKNSDGSWNTMRFIFSKWTLREGWDNPNVFQITKLRSSGSDTNKLQEVGRGLRLPVDEFGNRLGNQEFQLTYLIDFTEDDFAKKLLEQAETESGSRTLNIGDKLDQVASKRKMTKRKLFAELLVKDFVDEDKDVNTDKLFDFQSEYPEFFETNSGKITGTGSAASGTLKVRSAQFEEVRPLWSALNKKYFLKLDDLEEAELARCIDTILDQDIAVTETRRISEDKIVAIEGQLGQLNRTVESIEVRESLEYGDFLKKIHRDTGLPISQVHSGLVRKNKKTLIEPNFFTNATADKFRLRFYDWMEDAYKERFSYVFIDSDSRQTKLTDAEGKLLTEIRQGNIGTYRNDGQSIPSKYLYDTFVFDSPIESDNIRDGDIEEVIVYGKIPSKSIRIPMYFGDTSSPDFMYVVKTKDGAESVNFVVESKDVERSNSLRGKEELNKLGAKKFFEAVMEQGIPVTFELQMKDDGIVGMLNKVSSASK